MQLETQIVMMQCSFVFRFFTTSTLSACLSLFAPVSIAKLILPHTNSHIRYDLQGLTGSL